MQLQIRLLFFGFRAWNDCRNDLSEVFYCGCSVVCRHNSRIHHQQITEGAYESYHDRQAKILERYSQTVFRNKEGKRYYIIVKSTHLPSK